MLTDVDAPDLVCRAGISERGEAPAPSGNIGEAAGLMRQVKVVGRRNASPAIVGLALQNGNQSIRLGEWIRVQRQRIDDGEQSRVCSNPKRQRKNR